MALVRDKGTIPLDRPDAKIYGVRDEVTGYMAVCFLDLQAKKYALWWEPRGWSVDYYSGDVTDAVLAVHNGHAKLMAVTWKETSPDGRAHFVVIDLEQLY